MPILDLHAGVSSGNVTALTAGGTVGATATIPAGDDASTYGQPVKSTAVLKAWGLETIAADTLYEAQLTSQDQADPLNGEWYNYGASNVVIGMMEYTTLPYSKGGRKIAVRQNTGAGLATPFTIDGYADGNSIVGERAMSKKVSPTITTFAALTAQAWGGIAFQPTQPIPNGKYAILGAKVRALTNVGLLRFTHPDFKGFHPGFPVVDSELALATSLQLTDRTQIFQELGYQFVYLSEVLGAPCCPVFSVNNNGTGLIIQALSVIADTPIVMLNLAKVGE